jgi:hypothetical protein
VVTNSVINLFNQIVEVPVSSCGAYTWSADHNVYAQSGDYSALLTNHNGCDSMVVLHLVVNPTYSYQVSDIACDQYTWTENHQTYSQSGTYTAQYTNQFGCDSVISLNLTIIQPIISPQFASACSQYTWPVNGQTYIQSGIYADTLMGASGCDSIVTLNLTIENETITQSGNMLSSSLAGTSFQWMDCTTNTPIPNATSQTFSPTANGNYAVAVNTGTCTSTSSCFSYVSNGLSSTPSLNDIILQPNPTTGRFEVKASEVCTVEVYNAVGQRVGESVVPNTRHSIDIGKEATGVYVLKVRGGDGKVGVYRVVKQ